MRQASIDAGHERRVQERKARKARGQAGVYNVEVRHNFNGEATLHAVYKKAKELWEASNQFPAAQRLRYLKGSFEWRRAVAAWCESKVEAHVAPITSSDPVICDDDPKIGLGPLKTAALTIFSGVNYSDNQKVNYLLGNFVWSKAVTAYGFKAACKTVQKVYPEWDGKERPTWYSRK